MSGRYNNYRNQDSNFRDFDFNTLQYRPRNGGGGGGKKHSGCKVSRYVPKEGANKGQQQMIVNAWMYRRNGGLTTLRAVTTSKSKLTEKGWYGSIACELINKTTGQKSFYWGSMEKATGKVVISALGFVANPKGGKGGYFGSFSSK